MFVGTLKGYLWNRIPKGDRLLLGSLFLSYVGSNTSDLKVINKGASGQQMYQKIRRADPKSDTAFA